VADQMQELLPTNALHLLSSTHDFDEKRFNESRQPTPFVKTHGVPPDLCGGEMQYRDPATGKTFVRKVRRSVNAQGHAFELTFSCYHGFQFLNKDRTRQCFVEALEEARRKLPIDLWAYVIMPEHVHVLVYPRGDEAVVGKIRRQVKEPVARRAIQFLEASAPDWLQRITVREGQRTRRRFWQPGGGYDRNGIEIRTVHAMIDYIHHNPVRRGLVERATDWEWSSARWYAGMLPVKIDMARTLPAQIDGAR
jgi:putative transposase